jgi:hypothetical protein
MTKQTEAMKMALEAQKYAIACLTNQLSTKDKHAYAVEKLDASIAALEALNASPTEQPAQSTADKSELEIVPANGSLLPAQQQEAKRTAWIFENRHGEKYTPKDHVFTRAEAEVSAMLLGHKSIGPAWLNEACEPAVDGITKGNT